MSTNSPTRKRKVQEEFHDPDYEHSISSAPKRQLRDLTACTKSSDADGVEDPSKITRRVSTTIVKEFQHEIAVKQNQLKEINLRLLKGQRVLEQLRFSIIADYYRKQEFPLSTTEAVAIRGKNSLFKDEISTPQIANHPSIRKIIGKNPQSYSDILERSLPERAAAKNAINTIRARSDKYLREERRIENLIRKNGVVVDHTKGAEIESEDLSKVASDKREGAEGDFPFAESLILMSSSKLGSRPCDNDQYRNLNTSRLNNMMKQIIVIGNTSKYIGRDNRLSHKWLVYVQSKDNILPLQQYIKKVRFQLHPSYRPNDIIDVCKPPFQVARCGWGEFPVRIHLFFLESLQQKPLQLIHNLVLDKTLSGMHTLGAETIMEIWLRIDNIANTSSSVDKLNTTSIRQSREGFDTSNRMPNKDNICQSSSSEIDEIRPLEVKEALDNIHPHIGIKKQQETIIRKHILEKMKTEDIANNSDTSQKDRGNTSYVREPVNALSSGYKQHTNEHTILNPSKLSVEHNLNNKNVLQNVLISEKTGPVTYTSVPNSVISAATNDNNTKLGPLIHSDKQPHIKVTNTAAPNISTTLSPIISMESLNNTVSKETSQRKTLEKLDSNGKAKDMQMLSTTSKGHMIIADSNKSPSEVKLKAGSKHIPVNCVNLNINQSKAIRIIVSTNSFSAMPTQSLVTTVANTKACNTLYINKSTKQKVFHKEGKLYLVDPFQVKLKQQQKKAVSLLKPQISLLKPESTVQHNIANDHDYISKCNFNSVDLQRPISSSLIAGTSANPDTAIQKSYMMQPQHALSDLHLGIRQMRAKASNASELLQLKRVKFEQKFLNTNFNNMRIAVEYLLVHLPLVAPKDSLPAAFCFVRHSQKDFEALSALKQQCCEWLRAKYVTRLMKRHKNIKELKNARMEHFWNTREIVIYARHHAFTCIAKAFELVNNMEQDVSSSSIAAQYPNFSQLIKKEIKSENFQYNTVSTQRPIQIWLSDALQNLMNNGGVEDNQIIDVTTSKIIEKGAKIHNINSQIDVDSKMQSLNYPKHLQMEHSSQLVSFFCRDIGIKLQPESVCEGIFQPVAQMMLARCLNLFVQKLLRCAVSSKWQTESQQNNLIITPQDIGNAITRNIAFDFLTNFYFGSVKYEDLYE